MIIIYYYNNLLQLYSYYIYQYLIQLNKEVNFKNLFAPLNLKKKNNIFCSKKSLKCGN